MWDLLSSPPLGGIGGLLILGDPEKSEEAACPLELTPYLDPGMVGGPGGKVWSYMFSSLGVGE